MDHVDFPWHPLGRLLVEEDFLAEADLERALAEQRRTGKLLGQILVAQGSVTGSALARALAKQHGVELRAAGTVEVEEALDREATPVASHERVWEPLGKLLLRKGVVSELALQAALVEKRKHQDRRLGEILVRRGYLSGEELASALAEQHGVEVETNALSAETKPVAVPLAPGQPRYQVSVVEFEAGRTRRTVVQESPNLLDAADFASDYIDRKDPAAVEIERWDGDTHETVWSYSRQRAEAVASATKSVVQTFGFDAARWDVHS
jgi:hypothetical protein